MAMSDHAQVIAPPPLIYGIALLILFALRWLVPLPVLNSELAQGLGATLIVLAAAFGFPGRRALFLAHTSVNPRRPTTSLVQTGPYRFTRNPLYIALTGTYLGIGLLANTAWTFFVLIPLLLVMHLGVILPEEKYLEAKFGALYAGYRQRVRRYL